jgi:arginine decarboxylase
MSYASEETKPRKKLVGNRIPKRFFITKGIGESDLAVHAGSFHVALHNAQIERCNIMCYSSILPGIATEIEKTPEVLSQLVHGSVMETIMANATARCGQRATAGIILAWLYDKETGEKYGGLVCEYNGDLPEKQAQELLKNNLEELYTTGYGSEGYKDKYELREGKLITTSFVPKKKFGTALVALCFLDYVVPILEKQQSEELKASAPVVEYSIQN